MPIYKDLKKKECVKTTLKSHTEKQYVCYCPQCNARLDDHLYMNCPNCGTVLAEKESANALAR